MIGKSCSIDSSFTIIRRAFLDALEVVFPCVVSEFLVDVCPHCCHDYYEEVWAEGAALSDARVLAVLI